MFVPTPPSAMAKNQTDRIPGNFQWVSWTKDSIYVRWSIADMHRPYVTGYQITYQAIGSELRTQIDLHDPAIMEYDITQLHENTNYELCMAISTNLTEPSQDGAKDIRWECIEATTATDSLSVALGSTFGAFLALGIIVLFVFLAKWQHNRKLKKQLQQVTPSGGDSYDSMAQQDGEIEMSDVSLQVHDDTAKWDFSSQSSSQFSNFVNGAPKTNHLPPADGADLGDMQHLTAASQALPSTSSASGAAKRPQLTHQSSTASSSNNPQPSTSTGLVAGVHTGPIDNAQCSVGLLKPPPPPGIVTTVTNKQPDQPPDVRPKDVRPKDVRPKDVRPKDVRPKDVRPRDVRPKDRPLLDLTNAYQNTQYGDAEPEGGGIRPNMSCNW